MPSPRAAKRDASPPASPATLPIDSPERRRLPLLLRRSWFSLNQSFRRRIAHLGVTPDQFTAMRTLQEARSGGLTQSELTRLMSSDPNTIASLLERMETMRLIRRKPHENDRRAKRIQLEPLGQAKYEAIREIALELQTEILTVLPKPKREEFLKHLNLVADKCRDVAGGNPDGRRRNPV